MGEDQADRDTVSAEPLLDFIKDNNLTQAEFARAIDESAQTITNWQARGIPWRKVRKVAKAMDVTIDGYLDAAERRGAKGRAFLARPFVHALVAERKTGALVIPMLAAEGAQGYGRSVPDADLEIGGLQVTRKWALANLPDVTSYPSLRLITAIGDSNSPTIQHGAIVMVDTSVTELKTDQFFVFARGDEILIKKAHRMLDGGIVIKGAAQDALAERIDPATPPRVIGRIVYIWNGRPA